MALAGVVVSIIAIMLVILVEWLKRPRLDIKPAVWQAPGPVPHAFASVRVYNRPLPGLISSVLMRATAQGCEVTLEFCDQAGRTRVLPIVPARWSSQPEPLRSVTVIDPKTGGQSNVLQFEPALVPESRRLNIPPGNDGHEVAVALQRFDGSAHAFGADSYIYPEWRHRDRNLGSAVYRVTVRLQASGIKISKKFELENLTQNFATFCSLTPLS